MAESIQESLLDNLLKSRYPLTYYLSRQQEFVKVFSTTQTSAASNQFEIKTNFVHKGKASLPPCFSVPDIIEPRAPEFNDAQNERTSDQDDNTTHNEQNQSPETDDEVTQAYDERPLLKSINDKITVKQ